ncbi:MAG TPA: cytochrome P450, partial [Polyangiaceae bacterium]|nr:cytochrome P450 [Polyangiaceae bacterium]
MSTAELPASPTSPASPARIDRANRRVSLDATDPAFYQDPYAAYGAIGAATPVFYWEELGRWCLTGYEAVNGVFRDKRFGREILHVATREEVNLPEPPEHVRPFYAVDDLTMLAREPPAHTRLRALVSRAFVARQIERLRPRVAALANELIDLFGPAPGGPSLGAGAAAAPRPGEAGAGATQAGPPGEAGARAAQAGPPGEAGAGAAQVRPPGEVDLITAFATPIPVIVVAELLGVPIEAAPDLLDWSHRMVAMYTPGRNRTIEDDAVAATVEFVAFLRKHVAERRKAPRDDLISHLIAAERAGDRLSEDELIAGCIQLLNAGHEATVHAIGNAVKAMLESGRDPRDLVASPEATAATVEEALRFDPPLHFFDRFALEPVEVAGVRLAKGEKIGLLLGAANRDPARWADPDRFDPGRPPLPHIAFGAGIHFCLGAPLARLEMQVALPVLFARLPGLRLASPPRYRNSWHFH